MVMETSGEEASAPEADGPNKGHPNIHRTKTEEQSSIGVSQEQHTRPPNGWPLPARPPTPEDVKVEGTWSENVGPSPFPARRAGTKVFGPFHSAWKRKWD